MRLLAIDPGSEQSALLIYARYSGLPIWWDKVDNDVALRLIDTTPADDLAVECVASYGMAVGATTFSTVEWYGRFIERWLASGRPEPHRVFRRDCKSHLCGSQRAKDANIRQALIDRFGPGKDKAVGLKKSPGPLYGMKRDCWAALAVAVTCADTMLDAGREAA